MNHGTIRRGLMGLALWIAASGLPSIARAEDWLRTQPDSRWLMGVQSEYASTRGPQVRTLDTWRIGLAVTYRDLAWGPYLRVLVSPNLAGYEAFSGLIGTGLRAHFRVFRQSFSYGVATHAELRLLDHFWLAYATPIEVGTSVFERGTLRVQVLAGLRRAIGGSLVNVFLIDPNGFDNENAQSNLDRLRSEHPWQAYVGLEFSRLL